MRTNLSMAFAKLRKQGYFAKQNFMCCQSCGWAELSDEQAQKAVFYNKSQNRRVIVAQAGALLIRVHVHDDVNFKPGMEMPVEWVEGDLYKITRPSPRYLGRW